MSEAQGAWKEGENWFVTDKNGNKLVEMKGDFDERSIMQSIRLARKFELIAFNRGIEFGKELAKKQYEKLN